MCSELLRKKSILQGIEDFSPYYSLIVNYFILTSGESTKDRANLLAIIREVAVKGVLFLCKRWPFFFVGLYSLSSRLFLSKHNSLANCLSRWFLQLGFCDELYRLPSWSLLSNQHERLCSFTVPCWSIQQQIGYRLHSL